MNGLEFKFPIHQKKIEEILNKLEEEITRFNEYGKHAPISYAQGWVMSTEFRECTLRTLFDKADHNMYLNKQRQKEEQGE